jgi:hypothetical protein
MIVAVDENIPRMTVEELVRLEHDVLDIRGTSDQGSDDHLLWIQVQNADALLITTDKGFTDYRDAQHHGILIIRLRQPNSHRIHERIVLAIQKWPNAIEWINRMVVMRDQVQSVYLGSVVPLDENER